MNDYERLVQDIEQAIHVTEGIQCVDPEDEATQADLIEAMEAWKTRTEAKV